VKKTKKEKKNSKVGSYAYSYDNITFYMIA
jgi:hypothetical protein